MIPILLFPLARKFGAVLAVLAVIGAVYLWIDRTAYQRGYAVAEARLAAAQAESREATAKLETARLAAQAIRDQLTRQLEDAAREDPVANPAALSADRVRRLNAIR